MEALALGQDWRIIGITTSRNNRTVLFLQYVGANHLDPGRLHFLAVVVQYGGTLAPIMLEVPARGGA